MQKEAASLFESSEMLATFLASTPLLEQSWKLCSRANITAPRNYVCDRIGDVTFVSFSGVQMIDGFDSSCRTLVPLGDNNGVFSAFDRNFDGEKPIMLHSGLLNLFFCFYNHSAFRDQMLEIVNNSKSVVFTGHSIGGAIASLSALWLLSHLSSISHPMAVLCITFGSPMLGNESFCRAILQERWGGNFLHVVGQHDIVPRLLFAPSAPTVSHLQALFHFWHLSMASPYFTHLPVELSEERKAELFNGVLHSLETLSNGLRDPEENLFWPFGSYIFCTNTGSICLENAIAVIKLLHLMLVKGSSSSCIEDHLNYENYISKVYWKILSSSSFIEGSLSESSYEAGIQLALEASDLTLTDPFFEPGKYCLKMAKQMGRTPNLNCANLVIGLSKITPLRAQIEWYKATCDVSDNQLGYHDAFKQRGASKKDFKVNMNRLKLARFWNDVIAMLEKNELPYDFHKRGKWVNAAHFYKLLVEPLDIAEYYRCGKHLEKGHYLEHGRERRYIVFDKWWNDRGAKEETYKMRSKFASLTQDSCFWARVEEARDWLNRVRSERDARTQSLLWESISIFYQYARGMVEKKEVSKDVLAQNSSYNLFLEQWRELRSELQHLPFHFPGFLDGEAVA